MQTIIHSRTPHPEAVSIMQEHVMNRTHMDASFAAGMTLAHLDYDDTPHKACGTYAYTLFRAGREIGRAALGLEMEQC